jgi:hypothetical protein
MGVERKSSVRGQTDANDPEPTSPAVGLSAIMSYGSGPHSEVAMPARNLCRGGSLVTALTVLLGVGVAAEARDLRGAWVTDKSTCKKSVHR